VGRAGTGVGVAVGVAAGFGWVLRGRS